MFRQISTALAICLFGAAGAARAQDAPIPDPEVFSEGAMATDGAPMMDGQDGDYCDSCDDGYGGCCPRGCGVYGRVEWLHWWMRGMNVPALLTTSPEGTDREDAGVLPDATILYGQERLDFDGRNGARITGGWWCDPCQSCGIEANYFILENFGSSFTAASSGDPILGRPFYNVTTLENDAGLVAFPDVVAGVINFQTASRISGAEINARKMLSGGRCVRVDFLTGFRFARVEEDFRAHELTLVTEEDGPTPFGTILDIRDGFDTENQFYGGQIGFEVSCQRCNWTMSLLGKIAIGGMTQEVNINGSTIVTVPNEEPFSETGGFLALDSNIGQYRRSRLSVLPEIDLNLAYQFNRCWRANVGYTFMYLTSVVRPGDQIDTAIDQNQFPPSTGGVFPRFPFKESDVWLQGVNVGLEYRF